MLRIISFAKTYDSELKLLIVGTLPVLRYVECLFTIGKKKSSRIQQCQKIWELAHLSARSWEKNLSTISLIQDFRIRTNNTFLREFFAICCIFHLRHNKETNKYDLGRLRSNKCLVNERQRATTELHSIKNQIDYNSRNLRTYFLFHLRTPLT